MKIPDVLRYLTSIGITKEEVLDFILKTLEKTDVPEGMVLQEIATDDPAPEFSLPPVCLPEAAFRKKRLENCCFTHDTEEEGHCPHCSSSKRYVVSDMATAELSDENSVPKATTVISVVTDEVATHTATEFQALLDSLNQDASPVNFATIEDDSSDVEVIPQEQQQQEKEAQSSIQQQLDEQHAFVAKKGLVSQTIATSTTTSNVASVPKRSGGKPAGMIRKSTAMQRYAIKRKRKNQYALPKDDLMEIKRAKKRIQGKFIESDEESDVMEELSDSDMDVPLLLPVLKQDLEAEVKTTLEDFAFVAKGSSASLDDATKELIEVQTRIQSKKNTVRSNKCAIGQHYAKLIRQVRLMNKNMKIIKRMEFHEKRLREQVLRGMKTLDVQENQ